MGNIKSFIEEFESSTAISIKRGKYYIRVWNNSIELSMHVSVNGNIVYIEELNLIDGINQGKGIGTQFLNWFCELADKHSVQLQLEVCSFGINGETIANYEKLQENNLRLIRFYARHGFVEIDKSRKKYANIEMKRLPKVLV